VHYDSRSLSRLAAVLILVVVPWLAASQVNGAEVVKAQQWQITADKITRYEDPPSVIAEGNVVLEKTETVTRQQKKAPASDWSVLLGEKETTAQKPETQTITETKTITTIKAEWIVYDMDLGTIKARGNLLIDIGPDKLQAEEGIVDLNQETGTFKNATIIRQYKDLHLEGRVIEKTGDLTYHIEDGWIISCKLKEGETPPWSFGAADAEITDNGYAFLKHATFRIKDVPVFYLPYMLLPAKRSRQTGFLFPSFSLSDRDGFGMELPFFLNLSPSSDLTFYPQYLAERGFMAGLEFRYVLDQESKGTWMVNYLDDALSDPDDPDNREYYQDGDYTHTNQERYWIRGKADQNFGPWITRVDVDIVSDRDYLTEFNTGFTGFSASHDKFFEVFGRGFQNKTEDQRNNTLRILRSWENGISLQGDLLGINDVRQVKTSPTPLWKLPSLQFTGLLPLYDTGIDFSWDADFVYYWREEGVRAQRLDLFPRLSMAVPLSDYLETTVDAGIRNTSYLIDDNGESAWEDSSSENRFLADFKAETGTTMIRDFAVNLGTVNRWQHTFRPYVNYHFIPDVNQEDLPKFDEVDSIGEENLISYGLDNFFSIFGTANGKEYQRDYGYLKIRHGYDFRSSESDTPFTPVNIKLAYYPLREMRFLYKTDIDVYGDGFTFHSLEADYRSSRGDVFSADYRYNEQEKINSIKANARINLWYNLTAGYGIERSIEDSRTVEENVFLIYQQPCWSLELAANRTPGDQKYTIMFRLANIGQPLGFDF